MNTTRNKHILRWGVLLVTLVSALGVYAFSVHVQQEGWFQLSQKLQLTRLVGWVFVGLLAILSGYVWFGGEDRAHSWLQGLVAGLERLRWLLVPVMLALAAVYPILVMGPLKRYFAQDGTRQALFLWLALVVAALWMAFWRTNWGESLMGASLSLTVVYHLVTYFPHVTNYPFALWWSETTRYYLGSTFFAERIYGETLPWVFRDFSRYLMQAVPFLVTDSPLWVHRLWQMLLRFSTPYLTGMVIARKYKLSGPLFWAFTAWAGLYLFQGPVFYNLIVMVMLMVWLADARRFWKTLLAVMLVSVYAGLSRINWVPVPALMAAAYYFLRRPVEGRDLKSVARYLFAPAVWTVVGVAIGMGIQQFWAVNSGNPPEIYYSSFTSYLLWYRLFPNPSYPLGVLPFILLVTAPLLIFLLLGLRNWKKNWHYIRILALMAIVGVLFVGGLVVSTKIGGGTNLHNMDGYFVLLLVIALELYFGKAVNEEHQPVQVPMPMWLKTAVLVMPILFTVSFSGMSFMQRDWEAARQDLVQIQKYVDQATEDGGEVLFITQRHLITFGLIDNVTLVHDHEKVLLQEMAMSKNYVYLENFGAELASHKYDLILMDHLPSVWKNPETTSLAMENNVVLNELVPLFTCAYEVEDVLVNNSVDVMVPKDVVTCEQGQE